MKQGADPAVWTLANIEKMRKADSLHRRVPRLVEGGRDLRPVLLQMDAMALRAPVRARPSRTGRRPLVKVVPEGTRPCSRTSRSSTASASAAARKSWRSASRSGSWRITAYAERLLADLDELPWREDIKDAQRAWIGRSEGARLSFALSGRDERIEGLHDRGRTPSSARPMSSLRRSIPLVGALMTSIGEREGRCRNTRTRRRARPNASAARTRRRPA